jgi:hypothetical protein
MPRSHTCARTASRALTLALALAVGLTASTARAEGDAASDKAACVTLLDRAQSLQSGRKLRDARASYLACSNDACPELVREDCARSLVALDATLPSAVFSAVAETGDITDVRVAVDGETVSERLDGRSFSVDPGEHVARFLRAGRTPVEVRFVAREGEKNRQVSAVFGVPRVLAATPAKAEGKKAPVVPLLLAGTGALALGGALGFRLSADSDAADLRRTCAPACDAASRDALSDKLAYSNVSLAIGLGALAASGIVWLIDSNR